jgi:hypothetical protein
MPDWFTDTPERDGVVSTTVHDAADAFNEY